ncbi:Copper transport ctr4 [Fusarium acutatum]|uniref:Copper transport protein n=1 Tax=Fusarium acutatum TaxID=78861 RepID=A0A8H4JZE7_9HYPO|nr:Copper transport ctr4 [Fusarium acutatum]
MHPTSATALASSSARQFGSCLRNTMLWNWNTIGACFISEGWYIGSGFKFAITCLGAVGVAMMFEFTCRVSREWERHIFARDVGNPQESYAPIAGIELAPLQPAAAQPIPALSDQSVGAQSAGAQSAQPADARSAQSAGAQSADSQPAAAAAQPMASRPGQDRVPPFFPSLVEHALIKALLHTLQLVIVYVLILMTVSFNGYVIIGIFIGHYFGFFLCGRDPLTETNKPNAYQRVFQQPVICCDV